MDRIIVSVSDLLARAKELEEDGMDLVELSMMDPLEDDGEIIPASLWVSAFKKSFPEERVDYDEIEAVEGLE